MIPTLVATNRSFKFEACGQVLVHMMVEIPHPLSVYWVVVVVVEGVVRGLNSSHLMFSLIYFLFI